jgi:hypothetical protein
MIKFFVKASRPSKEEKALAEKIYNILLQAEKDGNKDILSAVESHGAVYNLDGLKDIYSVISEKSNSNNSNNNTMGKTNDNNSEKEEGNISSRGDGLNAEEVKFEEVPNIAEESQFQQPPVERENAYDKYANTGGSGSDSGNGDGGEGGGGGEGEEEFEEPRESGDSEDNGEGEDFTASGGTGNLKDLPPDTKRKAIKKTSEIVAKIYAGVLPILPKMVSKIPEAKLERMSWNDEIDLGMRLELPDGSKTNVGSYIRLYNQQLDNELVITPEQQKEFQDCLKDVLEEKQVAMTPMQRLTATVCAQAFTMLSVAVQNTVMMKKNLDYWKEVHEENKRRNRPQKPTPPPAGGGAGGNPPPPPPKNNPPVDNTPPVTDPPSPNGKEQEANHEEIQEENEELTIAPETAEDK